jgi:hypothetical protein
MLMWGQAPVYTCFSYIEYAATLDLGSGAQLAVS